MADDKQVAALQYNAGVAAPIIIGHARGDLAGKALKLAKQLGIPVHENDFVAQTLVKMPIGSPIPEDLYAIIAVLYKELILKSNGDNE